MSEAAAERPGFLPHPSMLLRIAGGFYLATIPFQGKIAPLELGSFAAIFCLGWALARREVRFSTHILCYPLLLYGLVSTISALAAPRRLHAYGESMLWFKMLIFPAALILLRELPGLDRWAVRAQALFAFYVSMWGLGEFFLFDRRTLETRIDGPASHVMTFSGLLLPLSLMMLLLWWHERRWWQLTAGATSTLALLLTFTRSVWLGWIAAAFVILALARLRLVFYALPPLILFVTFLPLSLFGRLVSTFDVAQSSNLDRIRMVQAGVAMIEDHPLLGVGPANVKEIYPLYRAQDAPRPRPPHLHNNVVQLWAERGLFALVGYVLLLALFLRECRGGGSGELRKWRDVGLAVAVSLTVAGVFEFNFGDTEVFYLLLNLFALVVVALERARPSNEPERRVVADDRTRGAAPLPAGSPA